MRRFTPVFAASILVLALLVPCPATAAPTARIDVPELTAAVHVTRDSNGIPHVYAANRHDLYFVQGWVHATDRLFQMDLSRRQASGTLAEVLGPAALGSDVQLRTLGLRRAAERALPLVSPEAQADLEAYADGVNAWLASNPLPPEYAALELTSVAAWTPVDSLVIAKLIAFGLSFDLDVDATIALMTYAQVGQAAGFDGEALFFEDLFRSAPFDPASTVPDATGAGFPSTAPLRALPSPSEGGESWRAVAASKLGPAAVDLMHSYAEKARQVPILARAMNRAESFTGSNEWAIAGHHTADGRPLVANDPHLALDTPATFHQIHLRSPADRIDVIGSGFPGTPYVILGQNRRITWGATTNPLDVTDSYIEQVVPDATSPSGLATVYMGTPEPIIPIPELFRHNQLDGTPDNLATAAPNSTVDGTFIPPATLIVPRRNQGPIVDLDTATGMAISVQYTGWSGTREIDAFRLWNRARNLDEFQRGLEFFDVGSQNWAYGDVFGNIAYFTSAEMPIREDLQAMTVDGLPPWFLRDGTGGNEWLPVANPQPEQAVPYEILPADEMPHTINPAAGWFVNCNNDPAGTTLDNDPLNQLRPGGGLYYLNVGYAQGTRAGRATARVREVVARGNVTAEDMMAIQSDNVMLDALVFRQAIGDSVIQPGITGPVREAGLQIFEWDGSTPTGIALGYDAADVDGVTTAPTQAEIDASIAATLYSVWRGQFIRNTIDFVLDGISTQAGVQLPRPGSRESIVALRQLMENDGVGASGIDFFAHGTGPTPGDRRDSLIRQSLEDALDLLASDEFAPAFANSTDQDDYRWGRLHRIRLDHPLGGPFSIPPAGGGFLPTTHGTLPGIPVDGGFGVVDASSHSARADGVNEFMFGSGPVRRYVGRPGVGDGSIEGWTSMPGGESGVLGHPFFFNLLPRWLTNDVYPMLHRHGDVQSDVYERTIFRPAG
ncbi:MAG TPA: penicillin acylase family protein [Thermoanaerobaculia bacterium]|nr:penicillin acylase family protein [Thermoanaerobaculia bacterium]